MKRDDDDSTLGPETKMPLKFVVSLIGALVGLGLALATGWSSLQGHLQRIEAHMARMEQHIATDWTTRDMAVWLTFFKNSNATNLVVPDVDAVKKWGP